MALLSDSADARSFKVPLAATESLEVETSGVGQPVVLIPGLFGSEFGFRTLVPLLNAAGYRTIVIEPLGIGSAPPPPPPGVPAPPPAGPPAGGAGSPGGPPGGGTPAAGAGA